MEDKQELLGKEERPQELQDLKQSENHNANTGGTSNYRRETN